MRSRIPLCILLGHTLDKYVEQITLIHLNFANMGLNDEKESGRDKNQTREKNREVNRYCFVFCG